MSVSFRGISSGLEVNKIIAELMRIERQPIRRGEARIGTAEQELRLWRDLNLRLDALQRSLQPLLLPSTYSSLTARSADVNVAAAAVTGPAPAGSYRLSVDQPATRHTVAAQPGGGELIADAAAALGLSGTFALGTAGAEGHGSPAENPGRWITVEAGDSLNQIARRVNEREETTGVRALVVKAAEGDYRLLLESRVEGATGRITFAHFQPQSPAEEAAFGGDPILLALRLVDAAGNYTRELQQAKDALLRLNGLEITRGANTVADLIPGVTLTLNGIGETVVSVEADQERAVSAVRAFIDAYNQANAMLRALQDRETGPLRGDPVIMRTERQLRQIASGMLPERSGEAFLSYRTLAEIGIKTIDRQGFLELDESRFRAAHQENAGDLFRLLGGLPRSGEGGEAGEPGGLAWQMRDFAALIVGSGGIISGRQGYLQQQIRELQRGIERWEYRLELRERNLARQFAAMERFISVMQGQSGMISNFARLTQNARGE